MNLFLLFYFKSLNSRLDLSDDANKAKLKLQAVSCCQFIIIAPNLNLIAAVLFLHCSLCLDNVSIYVVVGYCLFLNS